MRQAQRTISSLPFLLLAVATILYFPATRFHNCSKAACPNLNTCCEVELDGNKGIGCLTVNPHYAIGAGTGVCCGPSLSGCNPGYLCSEMIADGGQIREVCARNEIQLQESSVLAFSKERALFHGTLSSGSCRDGRDVSHPPVLPRYTLCVLPSGTLDVLHGFPVKSKNWELAYYSNMGEIMNTPMPWVRKVVISVHGSSRNADDYLCAAQSAAQLQNQYQPDSVLVLAPRFLAKEDGPVKTFRPSNSSEDGITRALRWNDTDPIPHTWRYGADSIDGNTSSFEAMDALVEHFANRHTLFEKLESVTVIGHSAGGQLAQRWALLSSSVAFDEDKRVKLRSVATNPRSYSYLDGRRMNTSTQRFSDPIEAAVLKCPGYDQWEWGLGKGLHNVERLPTPYKDRAIDSSGGVSRLVRRYLRRRVIYLAGSLDLLPLRQGCEDNDFQGSCRYERAQIYNLYIKSFNNMSSAHRLVEVDGVGHDHSLMYTSKPGLEAIFDPY